jgi:hypothetical protein
MRWRPTLAFVTKVGKHHIHYCLKCFDNKNVVVASLDIEIYSVVFWMLLKVGDSKVFPKVESNDDCVGLQT